MTIENHTAVNFAILQVLQEDGEIDITHRMAFDLAKRGGFVSFQVDQVALHALISELKEMNDDDLRTFRRELARQELENRPGPISGFRS